jgi:hypothetical protein
MLNLEPREKTKLEEEYKPNELDPLKKKRNRENK